MAGTERLDFQVNAGAAGNGTDYFWKGGKLFFYAEAGTWNSASVAFQFLSPNGTWIAVASGSLSANGGAVFELPAGRVRAVITGTPTGLYASAMTVPTITTR